jgi:hypothetical protein
MQTSEAVALSGRTGVCCGEFITLRTGRWLGCNNIETSRRYAANSAKSLRHLPEQGPGGTIEIPVAILPKFI